MTIPSDAVGDSPRCNPDRTNGVREARGDEADARAELVVVLPRQSVVNEKLRDPEKLVFLGLVWLLCPCDCLCARWAGISGFSSYHSTHRSSRVPAVVCQQARKPINASGVCQGSQGWGQCQRDLSSGGSSTEGQPQRQPVFSRHAAGPIRHDQRADVERDGGFGKGSFSW